MNNAHQLTFFVDTQNVHVKSRGRSTYLYLLVGLFQGHCTQNNSQTVSEPELAKEAGLHMLYLHHHIILIRKTARRIESGKKGRLRKR